MPRPFASQKQSVETTHKGSCVRVSFDVVVMDPQALWHAAVRIASQPQHISVPDIEDVLGPMEDPMIIDCLAMLTAPDAIAGCAPMTFDIEPITEYQVAHVGAHAVVHKFTASDLMK
jgi:hypothetical protein